MSCCTLTSTWPNKGRCKRKKSVSCRTSTLNFRHTCSDRLLVLRLLLSSSLTPRSAGWVRFKCLIRLVVTEFAHQFGYHSAYGHRACSVWFVWIHIILWFNRIIWAHHATYSLIRKEQVELVQKVIRDSKKKKTSGSAILKLQSVE